MKKVIKLNESELFRIINSVVKKSLNEGTDKQDAYLRRLLGSKFTRDIELTTPWQASKLIDRELNKERNKNPNGAKLWQIERIRENPHYKIPWIEEIEDRLMFEDGQKLISALRPFDGKINIGGYPQRMHNWKWIPLRTKVLAEVARKYGLEDAARHEEEVLAEFERSRKR